MSGERTVVPFSWRVGLALARVALAITVASLELYPSFYPLTTVGTAFLIYSAYSLFVLWWERRDHGASDLLRLIFDVVALVVCALNPPDRSGWLLGSFYLFVLVATSILHQLREMLMVVGLMFALAALTYQDQAIPIAPVLVIPGVMASALAFQRRAIEERLAVASRQSIMFRSEADNARELERQRIAADLHDGPLQSFISFQMRLEVIKKLLQRDQAAAVDDMVQLQEICRKQITDMRAFVRSMRMSSDGSTPATSVRQIAEDFQKSSGIALTYNVGDALSGLEPEVSHEVLQVVREALHNAQKHSKASKVILLVEKSDNSLQILIEDDGSGFPFGGSYNLEELELMRMGPESIKRRVRTLSGELTLDSTPGRGAKLRVRVPL